MAAEDDKKHKIRERTEQMASDNKRYQEKLQQTSLSQLESEAMAQKHNADQQEALREAAQRKQARFAQNAIVDPAAPRHCLFENSQQMNSYVDSLRTVQANSTANSASDQALAWHAANERNLDNFKAKVDAAKDDKSYVLANRQHEDLNDTYRASAWSRVASLARMQGDNHTYEMATEKMRQHQDAVAQRRFFDQCIINNRDPKDYPSYQQNGDSYTDQQFAAYVDAYAGDGYEPTRTYLEVKQEFQPLNPAIQFPNRQNDVAYTSADGIEKYDRGEYDIKLNSDTAKYNAETGTLAIGYGIDGIENNFVTTVDMTPEQYRDLQEKGEFKDYLAQSITENHDAGNTTDVTNWDSSIVNEHIGQAVNDDQASIDDQNINYQEPVADESATGNDEQVQHDESHPVVDSGMFAYDLEIQQRQIKEQIEQEQGIAQEPNTEAQTEEPAVSQHQAGVEPRVSHESNETESPSEPQETGIEQQEMVNQIIKETEKQVETSEVNNHQETVAEQQTAPDIQEPQPSQVNEQAAENQVAQQELQTESPAPEEAPIQDIGAETDNQAEIQNLSMENNQEMTVDSDDPVEQKEVSQTPESESNIESVEVAPLSVAEQQESTSEPEAQEITDRGFEARPEAHTDNQPLQQSAEADTDTMSSQPQEVSQPDNIQDQLETESQTVESVTPETERNEQTQEAETSVAQDEIDYDSLEDDTYQSNEEYEQAEEEVPDPCDDVYDPPPPPPASSAECDAGYEYE